MKNSVIAILTVLCVFLYWNGSRARTPEILSLRSEVKKQVNSCFYLKSALVSACIYKTIDEVK